MIMRVILCAVMFAGPALAHGGGLNAEGCHNDRKNGGYHCHRGSSQPAPVSAYSSAPARAYGSGGAFANCAAARAAGA